MFPFMLFPPALLQAPTPPPPPGSSGLTPLGRFPIQLDKDTPVAVCTIQVDLRALRKWVKGASEAQRGPRGLEFIAQGRVRVWVATEYLVEIGTQRRRRRIEELLRKAWPTPGEDPMTHPAFMAYLDAACIEINPPDVHGRFIDPQGALWFQAPGKAWRRFPDAKLAKAYVRSELGNPQQDPQFYAALLKSISARLAD